MPQLQTQKATAGGAEVVGAIWAQLSTTSAKKEESYCLNCPAIWRQRCEAGGSCPYVR